MPKALFKWGLATKSSAANAHVASSSSPAGLWKSAGRYSGRKG